MSCSDSIPQTLVIKRGDAFDPDLVYRQSAGGPGVDLTLATIASQIRKEDGTLVSTATVTKANQATDPGLHEVLVADTTAWPLQKLIWDVKYTFSDGRPHRTDTAYLRVVREATE